MGLKKIIRGIFKSGKNDELPKKRNDSRPRSQPTQRSTSTVSILNSQQPSLANTSATSEIFNQKKLPILNESDISNSNERFVEDDLNNESDEGIITSNFISSKHSNLRSDYMDIYDSLHFNNNHSTPSINNEYNTISSISSTSHLSLEDALFSYISSDSRSEITNYSTDTPKIAVQSYGNERSTPTTTARIIDSLFDSDYQVSNHNDKEATADATKHGDFLDTISDYDDLPTDKLQWEKYFVELYINASRAASESDIGYAQAFLIFEFISNKGGVHFEKLTNKTKLLVSFAQYRVGAMLYEAKSDEYDTQSLGLRYLNESRKHGNFHATYYLGSVEYHSGDHERAYDLFYEAAKKGYVPAMVSFGHYILFRTSKKYSESDALRFLHLAVDMNHQFALLSLAVYFDISNKPEEAIAYCQNLDVSKNSPIYGISCYCISIIYFKVGLTNEAFSYMKLASQTDYTKAKRKLGIFFLHGIGISQKNPEAAFRLIEEASRCGDPVAETILGQFYMEGVGCKINFIQAMNIFQNRDDIAARLARAKLLLNSNTSYALANLKVIIERTSSYNDEVSEINELWDIRMIRNEARRLVALCILEGTEGMTPNPRQAIAELHDLADRENYSVAQCNLAIVYSNNVTENGVTIQRKNDEKAFWYFLKGANGGDPESQYQVGRLLQEGNERMGLSKLHAFKYFECAAQQNHVLAQAQLGVYYYVGLRPLESCDYSEAFKWLNMAAKKGDETAIMYLADYLLKHNSFDVNPFMVFTNLLNSASKNNNAAYRMLGLIAMRGINFMADCESQLSNKQQYKDVVELYNAAQKEQNHGQDLNFRFGLQCLWKAIKLNDHKSGEYILKCLRKMNQNDMEYTIECFKSVERGVATRMTLAYGQFLNAVEYHYEALKKFKEVAESFRVSSNTGRNARFEFCRLVVIHNIGKARAKVDAFNYLKEIIKTTTNENASEPLILLGKCCDQEICLEADCKKDRSITYYEKGLKYRSANIQLQNHARMRLVELYYENMDSRMIDHLDILFDLIVDEKNMLNDKQQSQIYYYKGIYTLHKKTNPNRIEDAEYLLQQSIEKDKNNYLAFLELGYVYSIKFGEENKAQECFDKVEEISIRINGGVSLLNREPEFNILLRNVEEQSERDIVTMKLGAAITYGYHNMVHQAVNWLDEITGEHLAEILHLYFKMNSKKEQNQRNVENLQEMISPYEQKVKEDLNYCERSMLTLCNLRLGECVEEGITDDRRELAREYYYKSRYYDDDNRLLFKKLLPSMSVHLTKQELKRFLFKASKKDKNPMFEFELAKLHRDDNPESRKGTKDWEKVHLEKAANLGHVEANYLCGLKLIEKLKKEGKALNSKTAASYFEAAAKKNHGPSYFELSKLRIQSGYFEEGIEDMKEADFLGVAEASYQLGEYHLTGFFGAIGDSVVYKITCSPEESKYYFRKAADLNYPQALIKLGYFYEQAIGVPRDLQYAYSLYREAIVNGCPNGAGEYALGCWIETILDSEDENSDISHEWKREDAYNWFKKAWDNGNQEAKYKVGSYLISEKIVNQTNAQQQGLQILIEQCDQKNTKAMLELARFYETRNDLEKAKIYWMKAVHCNDPDALEYLELSYKEGRLGLEINYKKAMEFKDKAIEARKSAIERQCSSVGLKSDRSINQHAS